MKTPLEVRLTANAGLSADLGTSTNKQSGPTLRGYAAVFNSSSQDLGGFVERIRPGAFADSLKTRDVLGLYGHDYSALLGRVKNGTLSLHEDSRGLAFELRLPRTQLGADLAVLVERGDLSQMSFGFTVPPGGDAWGRERGLSLRTLRAVTLYEISIVAEPAYLATSVGLRRELDAVLAATLDDYRRRLEALL